MTDLFYAILKASFHGSIVILAVMLLRLLLKKAPKSIFCLLWLLAGARLALPFEIESSLSLQPDYSFFMEEESIRTDILNRNGPVIVGTPEQATTPVTEQSPALPEENRENSQTDAFIYQVEDGTITGPVAWTGIAANVWLLGMGIMLAVSAVSYIRLKRRVRAAYPTEDGCFECPGLETAFVLGFMPPKIYLPANLSDREKAFIYDHENTHIARRDHWHKLMGYCVLALHWFNPLVWLAYHLLCRDIELACDEHVVRNMSLTERKAYSAALLSCGSRTARLIACPVAFGESNPKKRILNVLSYKRPGFWISLAAVIAVVFVGVCLLTSPAEEQPPEEPDTMQWNLEMEVADVTPRGLQVKFVQTGIFCGSDRGHLAYGTHYTLQRYENGQWVDVKMLPQDHEVGWTLLAYIIELNSTATHGIDWAWLYGELPAGHYRIGMTVTFFRNLEDDESNTFYAEFDISGEPAWNLDMTDAEFLAMCRKAVEELQNREQFHISETIAYFTGETEDSRNSAAYWRDGENWLRESYITRMKVNADYFYYDGTLYLRRQEESGEVNWNRIDGGGAGYGDPWLCMLQWDDQKVTFEGTDVKGEELCVSVLVHATPPTLGWDEVQEYNILFCFNSSGNMTRAVLSAHREPTRVISDLTIENTLVSNIRNKLENVAAQRPDALQLSLTGEEWLEKCRSAMETYQSQKSWVILVENNVSGDVVLTENSSQLWYIHGEDWMRQGAISNSDSIQQKWYLHKDGSCYARDSVTIHNPADGESYVNSWQDCEDISGWLMPWPLEFDWDSADITFLETRTDGDGAMIYLNIEGSPYPGEYGDQAEEYLVTLWLRPSGELWQVRLEYTATRQVWMNDEKRAVQEHIVSTIGLHAGSPEEAEQMIHQCHEEAMQHIHDQYGIACTVEHCTNPSHHHSDENHH